MWRIDPLTKATPLSESILATALAQAGLTVKPGELADVLATARYLQQAMARIRAASC